MYLLHTNKPIIVGFLGRFISWDRTVQLGLRIWFIAIELDGLYACRVLDFYYGFFLGVVVLYVFLQLLVVQNDRFCIMKRDSFNVIM